MGRQAHMVVIASEDGSPESYPLKSWLRENPVQNPTGLDPDEPKATSHNLRRKLKQSGWMMQSTATKVFLIQPDEKGQFHFADDLIDQQLSTDEELDDAENEAQEITFGLERDLQAVLRENIAQLESGMKINDKGKELSTDAGRIDITARDELGRIVVIELKAGLATSDVIPQTLAYMGALQKNHSNPIRGIIVASGFSDRIIYAAEAVVNLDLVKYNIYFNFERTT